MLQLKKITQVNLCNCKKQSNHNGKANKTSLVTDAEPDNDTNCTISDKDLTYDKWIDF